jgi:hypothetical protein
VLHQATIAVNRNGELKRHTCTACMHGTGAWTPQWWMAGWDVWSKVVVVVGGWVGGWRGVCGGVL